MPEAPTFGSAISEARKRKGLSQKDLASRIMREEGGGAISPQYLNDIEHDRRSPSSDHMIQELSRELDISENVLSILANRVPPKLRNLHLNPQTVDRLVQVAFRQSRPVQRKA